jgi:selenide,water dikinase
VTGSIDPTRVLSNAGAKPGDVLFLTKPLGTGIVGTAIKFDRAAPALVDAAIASMRTLNRAAAEALRQLAPGLVHACPGITGVGLIGHGSEMAAASGVTLTIAARSVPLFDGVLSIVGPNRSGGLGSNQAHFSRGVSASGVDPDLASLLYDPQTSGGLLISVAAGSAGDVAAALEAAGVRAARIGTARPKNGDILVEIVV